MLYVTELLSCHLTCPLTVWNLPLMVINNSNALFLPITGLCNGQLITYHQYQAFWEDVVHKWTISSLFHDEIAIFLHLSLIHFATCKKSSTRWCQQFMKTVPASVQVAKAMPLQILLFGRENNYAYRNYFNFHSAF